jgi:hypothetical protein
MLYRNAVLALIVSSVAGSSPAWALEAWEEQLQAQTRIKSGAEYASMESKGYRLLDVARTSLLNASASEMVPLNLPAGKDYVIMGVCDNDCSDLDLSLMRNGAEVSTDTTSDDWPLVDISGGGDGYQVNVKMYECSTSNCGYQLTVWQREAGSTPAASSSGSSSESEWEQQLQAQTRIKSGAEYANMAAKGYSLMDVAQTALLAASGNENVSVSLAPGSEYIIMGVCDNDCSDLDLAVIKGGMELSKDTTSDDWPLVDITPTGSSDYEIKVTMYECSTSNCGYQLTVWKK